MGIDRPIIHLERPVVARVISVCGDFDEVA